MTKIQMTCDECGTESEHNLDKLYSVWEAQCPNCNRIIWRTHSPYSVMYETACGTLQVDIPKVNGTTASIARSLADGHEGELAAALHGVEAMVLAMRGAGNTAYSLESRATGQVIADAVEAIDNHLST